MSSPCEIGHLATTPPGRLPGPERLKARLVLKETISVLDEAEMSSTRAAEDRLYQDLGPVDAAIGAVARPNRCAALTDDLFCTSASVAKT